MANPRDPALSPRRPFYSPRMWFISDLTNWSLAPSETGSGFSWTCALMSFLLQGVLEHQGLQNTTWTRVKENGRRWVRKQRSSLSTPSNTLRTSVCCYFRSYTISSVFVCHKGALLLQKKGSDDPMWNLHTLSPTNLYKAPQNLNNKKIYYQIKKCRRKIIHHSLSYVLICVFLFQWSFIINTHAHTHSLLLIPSTDFFFNF